MANSHGLTSRIVKKQAASRKMAKNKKQSYQVYIWNENPQVRKNTSYKKRQQYDERGFFIKGKKKNFITKTMVDSKGLDFYWMPR